MKPEEIDCKWHNIYQYQVHGRPDCTVQYWMSENKKNYCAAGYN